MSVDAALLAELESRYLDLGETRARLQAARASSATFAAEALTQAESEVLRARERFQRVQRAFQDGHLEADDYAEQRTALLESVRLPKRPPRARSRVDGYAAEQSTVPDEVLERMSELRATVLVGVGEARDLNALRTLLGRIFKAVVYLPAGHPSLASMNLGADDLEVAGDYLLPYLNPGLIAGYEGENPNFDADYERWLAGDRLALGPFDPNEPEPYAVLRRVAFPIADPNTANNSSERNGLLT